MSQLAPAAKTRPCSSDGTGRLKPGSILLSALQPASGLLGKEYAKDVEAGSARHLHIRADAGEEGLWRLSLAAVDGWKLGALDASPDDDRGPFARLLSA